MRVGGPMGQFSLDECLTDLLEEATDSWRVNLMVRRGGVYCVYFPFTSSDERSVLWRWVSQGH